MAKCEVEGCEKTGMSGHNVSHSKRRTNRRWFANVHKTTIHENGKARRINICTRCLRSMYKQSVKL
ncbi:MAG: 50S ribosomal protein L28 [Dehalococcoidia bacterium]|nr:50S ribosomal protein L28 [Dehalococcoidia bacterium]